ncbi:hypothetical protein AOLI_G00236150 [Acnodon oligacanthus]
MRAVRAGARRGDVAAAWMTSERSERRAVFCGSPRLLCLSVCLSVCFSSSSEETLRQRLPPEPRAGMVSAPRTAAAGAPLPYCHQSVSERRFSLTNTRESDLNGVARDCARA